MKLEFITKQDFDQFKSDITEIVTSSINGNKSKQWIRSKGVKEKLGISSGSLQNLRIQGHIPFTKLGGTLFYDSNDIDKILEENKIVN